MSMSACSVAEGHLLSTRHAEGIRPLPVDHRGLIRVFAGRRLEARLSVKRVDVVPWFSRFLLGWMVPPSSSISIAKRRGRKYGPLVTLASLADRGGPPQLGTTSSSADRFNGRWPQVRRLR